MRGSDDDNLFERAEHEEIDELLAQDRRRTLRTANERIAGGMYERIARAHAERSSAAAWKWQTRLVVAVAAAVLVVVWFALPKKGSAPTSSPSNQPSLVATGGSPVVMLPPSRRPPAKGSALLPSRPHWVALPEAVPRRATFPINVTATEQERLLAQLASQHPKELMAMAAAMEASKAHTEAEKQEFDQWLQQRGENQ